MTAKFDKEKAQAHKDLMNQKLHELDQALYKTIEIAQEVIYNSYTSEDKFLLDTHYQEAITKLYNSINELVYERVEK